MTVERLLEGLARPDAYPHPVDEVTVRQTHISVVFLAGDRAYKVKKPVELGFLDFSTLEKRRRACRDEVRLNRRLAPEVYRGVVPITGEGSGLAVEGAGPVVEWAVEMERLDDERTLLAHLRRGELERPLLRRLARRIADFHQRARSDEEVAAFGRFDVVAGNVRENFEQSGDQVGRTVSPAVFRRLRELSEEHLGRLRSLIERRASRGTPRDTHGDLHLDHVYHFPGRSPPRDLVAIDCIEFNERFRYADPVSDAAFLAMDLSVRGRDDLARSFADAYLRAGADAEGGRLFPLYVSYRAAVRGKVEGMTLREPEVPEAERAAAEERARAHWLLALGALERPGRRPALILVGGLPGTGKSTIARGLEPLGFRVLSSDRTRKALAGLEPGSPAPAEFDEGIYGPEWTDRTYRTLLRRARELLFRGERVVVDATFRDEERRRDFLDAAAALGVPALHVVCTADEDVARRRLARREEEDGGSSDAGWEIHRRIRDRWDAPGEETERRTRCLPTGGAEDRTVERARELVRRHLTAGPGDPHPHATDAVTDEPREPTGGAS